MLDKLNMLVIKIMADYKSILIDWLVASSVEPKMRQEFFRLKFSSKTRELINGNEKRLGNFHEVADMCFQQLALELKQMQSRMRKLEQQLGSLVDHSYFVGHRQLRKHERVRKFESELVQVDNFVFELELGQVDMFGQERVDSFGQVRVGSFGLGLAHKFESELGQAGSCESELVRKFELEPVGNFELERVGNFVPQQRLVHLHDSEYEQLVHVGTSR